MRPLLAVVLVGLFFSAGLDTPRVRAQARRAVRGDVDGDGRSDLVVWRPTDGVWYALESRTDYRSVTVVPFGSGAQNDIPLMGDFDGDGKGDLAVWRPSTNPGGTFMWRLSSSNYIAGGSVPAGVAAFGAVPLLGDLDGDGHSDPAIFHRFLLPWGGDWGWRTSSTNYAATDTPQGAFGAGIDQPMVADFNADGQDDLVLFRQSTGDWFWGYTGSNKKHPGDLDVDGRRFGGPGDHALIGDFDGDGRSDPAVWRPSTGEWFWLTSSSGWSTVLSRTFGSGSVGDIPQLGDFDGDGRTDLAIWRAPTGQWFWLTSSSSWSSGIFRGIPFGTGTLGDVPMLK